MLEEIYQKKEPSYFSNVRKDIVHFIKDRKGLKILEIGGGSGNTLLYLKENKIAAEIHMVDIMDLVANKEAFDSIQIIDIEEESLQTDERFDIIILADVLEHLKDPMAVISQLKEFLKKGGAFLVSIPNIRHYSAFIKIFLKGSFAYEDQGIFDKTHIRFFCKKDMKQLFEVYPDLQIEKTMPNNKVIKSKATLINTVTLGLCTQFFTSQYLFKITKG